MLCSPHLSLPRLSVLHRLLRLLLCLCLVANTATGAWASVGMAMPAMASGAMPAAPVAGTAATTQTEQPAALPCHEAMPRPTVMQVHDKATHAHAPDCCKLGSCDCLQHCSLALLTLPAVPAGLLGRPALPATLTEGRSSPLPDQPVRPPIA
ncbi:copper transporter [Xanthomonas citri pv. fuscans CFBP 6996]|uniref:CopL family metal-binding regulatory protein n=1 Tax=Xanthomonas citri TaxID=346 RepID=UPI000C19513F|nr:CopL family metal-binding regulatory protein [Xanthomonas citri]ATS53064.1 CopL family metal-binding regulatory protein [Xanthomonas citri pv. phaseoli var. fuscans]ATS54938.1 CopL family metal-binding regulatory protein [Xanthomonas citri pv. phaseoli var. fuscans]ATS61052.1 CopL family metal-binding regulatory protein [Xanthomonas citri pv. phaseoli var. fuscans]PTY29946.1 copper transporter [Xanthomonas citri pv. fuscans CFBP 6996]QWN17679.1 copper transporter [Xanthomonas citri]